MNESAVSHDSPPARPDGFARTLIHVPVLGSTSDEAKRLLLEGRSALPLVVRADRQTAGRGQGVRVWWSDAGSLLFTIGIDPEAYGLRTEHIPRVALVTALAVIAAIEAHVSGVRPGIRWPNDIEVDDRKLGGILPECVTTQAGRRLAIGIGLNVRNRFESAPAEVRALATSLSILSDQDQAIEPLFEAILERIEPELRALSHDDPGQVARFVARDELRDRPIRVEVGSEIKSGIARGIDSRGGLLFEADHEEGGTRPIFSGRVLRDPPSTGPILAVVDQA